MAPCNQERITKFLDRTLGPQEEVDLEQHLSGCQSCCRFLEDATAEHAWWSDVTSFLPDGEYELGCDTFAPTSLPEGEAIPDGIPLTGAIQNVLQLLAPTDDPAMLGRLNTYEIVGVIGAGGMSVVLKGFDRSLNRYVAIKVLSPQLSTSGAARQRFAREAQAAAAVVHENVMAIYGVEEGQGLPYLVMPYIRGESLQNRIDRNGPLGVEEILCIAKQSAAGLAAAHALGLVHRDVKPANILLANGVERVTITDFGLARAADDASLTRSGMIAGTPQYMSPEQARGESIDERSDLFSLGSVLYTLCTGRPPFRSETSYGVLRRITDTQPRDIQAINHQIPRWLCRIVEKLHAKNVADRYRSAADLATDLEQCLAHVRQPRQHALPTWLRKPTGWQAAKRPLMIGAILAASSLLLTFSVRNAPSSNPSNSTNPSTPSQRVPDTTRSSETASVQDQAPQQAVSQASRPMPRSELSDTEKRLLPGRTRDTGTPDFQSGLFDATTQSNRETNAHEKTTTGGFHWNDGVEEALLQVERDIMSLEAEMQSLLLEPDIDHSP